MTVHDLDVVARVENDLFLNFGICEHHRENPRRVRQAESTALVRFQKVVEEYTGMVLIPEHMHIEDNGPDECDPHVTRYRVRWEAPLYDCDVALRGGELDGTRVEVERVDGLIYVSRRVLALAPDDSPPSVEIPSTVYETSGWSDTEHCWVADLAAERA